VSVPAAQTLGEFGEPPELLTQERGGSFGHRQAHGQFVAESPELVVPARGNRPDLEVRQVRVQITNKITDKGLVCAGSFHAFLRAVVPG
jgi:hypothetical protein